MFLFLLKAIIILFGKRCFNVSSFLVRSSVLNSAFFMYTVLNYGLYTSFLFWAVTFCLSSSIVFRLIWFIVSVIVDIPCLLYPLSVCFSVKEETFLLKSYWLLHVRQYRRVSPLMKPWTLMLDNRIFCGGIGMCPLVSYAFWYLMFARCCISALRI